jgi:hypothetical protein
LLLKRCSVYIADGTVGRQKRHAGETTNVRYIVDDVEAAVAWYTTHLGFTLLSKHAPAFADVARGSLRLLLSGRRTPARPMPDGERPAGTAFILSSMIFPPKLGDCAPLA